VLITFGLLTRVAVVAWGVHCAHTPIPASIERGLIHDEYHLAALAAPARKWVEPWYRWDANWYAEVSAFGYAFDLQRQTTAGFLPLLPMVMATAAGLGLDRYWAGLLVPNLAFAVGLAAFGKVALRVTGDLGTTWRACLLAMAYPFSFFFSAPYHESLGFALTAAAMLAWIVRRPIASAVCLAGASLARLTTLAMSLGLIAEWFDDVVHRRPARHSAWLVVLSGGLGFASFCAYLGLRLGEPLAHLHAHSAWHRQSASVRNVFVTLEVMIIQAGRAPLFGVMAVAILFWTCQRPVRAALIRFRAWVLAETSASRPGPRPARRRSNAWAERHARGRTTPRDPQGPVPSATDQMPAREPSGGLDRAASAAALVLVLVGLGLALPDGPVHSAVAELEQYPNQLAICLFLGLAVHAFWRRGPLWGCLVLVPILQAMATASFMSITRLTLAAFPAFIDLAELLRPRAVFAIGLGTMLLAQVRLIDLFVNWTFVG
jgi:hypothetical protein